MWKTIRKQLESTDAIVSLILGCAVILVIGVTIINYVKMRYQSSAATTNKTSGESVSLPTTYTVLTGDTLWSISEKYYKSGYNWIDIRDANHLSNPDIIHSGNTLTIPQVPAKPGTVGEISAASVTNKPKESKYTVVAGDNLWKIAEYEYQNGYRWVDIAKANNLTDPGTIHAGNVLVMP